MLYQTGNEKEPETTEVSDVIAHYVPGCADVRQFAEQFQAAFCKPQ